MPAPERVRLALLAATLALPIPGAALAQDATTVGRPPAANPSTALPRSIDAEGNPPPVMPGLAEDPSLKVPTGLPPSTQPGARQDPGTGKPQ